MIEKYKKHLNKYIEDSILCYRLTNEERKIIFKNIDLEKKIIKDLNEEVAWEEMHDYFETAQYLDKYGLFDIFPNKYNVAQYIYKLYDCKCQIRFYYLIYMPYSFHNYGDSSEEEKIDYILNYLYLHIKRGVLKVRAVSEKNEFIYIDNEGVENIESSNWKYIEYNKNNSDLILTDLKNRYFNSRNKNEFAEWEVEIILAENEWK